MLQKILIKNFVLIEEVELEFKNGLNILTGETGAGKSILIDAISGILGDKMSTDMIRTGCERSVLEGVFDIGKSQNITNILKDAGIDCDDDILIIKRELFSSGKGRCFINSQQIPVAKLKEIGELLLVIHGQNEYQNIARISMHRELLDNYGCNAELLDKVGSLYNELQEIREKLSSLEMDEREKTRRIEYLSFALNEIKNAKLLPNEEDELREESDILLNAEKIFESINQSYELMKSEYGMLTSLKKIDNHLSSISEIDTNIALQLDNLRNAGYILEDIAVFLRSYENNIDYSPDRINQVEERLSLIASLKKKYGNSLAEIMQFAEKCESELNAISSSEEEKEKLGEIHKKKIEEAKKIHKT